MPGLQDGGVRDMGMKRRRFLGLVGKVGAAAAASVVWLADRTLPVRYVEAIRAGFYPGPRRPLDESNITKPSRWEG